MIPFLVAAAVAPCNGADPALGPVSSQIVKRRDGTRRYLLTTTLTNVGREDQTNDVIQHVEVVRDGHPFAPQRVPSLAAGIGYKLSFAVDRSSGETGPLTVQIRYVLESGDAPRNACDTSNDVRTVNL